MRLQSCFFPKVVHNQYTGQDLVCRCGRCNACTNSRAANWVKRLDLEASAHRYTLFATLTYNDYEIPQIVRLRKDDYPNAAYISQSDGVLVDCRSVNGTWTAKDWKYVSETKVLEYLSKSDFQKFIKRLRYYFDETNKGAKLRYYLCGEYGPRTYRPHGHILLFFDDERCYTQIKELLSKAWSHGIVYDPHLVIGSAAQYCASYLNSYYSLPKIYQHPFLRPFTLFSKSPSIGAYSSSVPTDRALLESGDCEFTVFNAQKHEFVNIPLWRSFEARLYPRCPRFGVLSNSERVALYRFIFESTQKCKETISAKSLAEQIKERFVFNYQRQDFLADYFRLISYKTEFGFHFLTPEKSLPWYWRGLPFLPKDVVIPQPLQAIKEPRRVFNENSLLAFSRFALRFVRNLDRYGLTFDDYYNKIVNYYDQKSYLRLTDYFNDQSEYFASHSASDFFYFDLLFFNKVTTTDVYSWSSSTLKSVFYTLYPLCNSKVDYSQALSLVLNYCKLSSGGFMVLNLDPLESHSDYKSFTNLHCKIAHDLVKVKNNNDYALQRKDKYYNIIHYQNS